MDCVILCEAILCGDFVAWPFAGMDLAQDVNRLILRHEMGPVVHFEHQADEPKGSALNRGS